MRLAQTARFSTTTRRREGEDLGPLQFTFTCLVDKSGKRAFISHSLSHCLKFETRDTQFSSGGESITRRGLFYVKGSVSSHRCLFSTRSRFTSKDMISPLAEYVLMYELEGDLLETEEKYSNSQEELYTESKRRKK